MTEVDAAIGRNVARLRGAKTQQEIADAMRGAGFKWSQATMWSVEKGERPVRLAEAQVLAGVFDCSLERLLASDVDSDVAEVVGRIERDSGRLLDLARRIGTSRVELAKLLNGRVVSRAVGQRAAEALQQSPADLVASLVPADELRQLIEEGMHVQYSEEA